MPSKLENFQAAHGGEWAGLVSSPAFSAAFVLLNGEKIQSIAALTDDEIAIHAQIILSDLRGHLQHEFALLGLHEQKSLVFQQLDHEEYPDPIDEAREQSEQEHQEAQSNSSSGAVGFVGGVMAHEEIFPPPKKRGRPPGKKSVAKKSKPRKIRK